MAVTHLDRAIRTLRYQQTHRRAVAITLIVCGLFLIVSGWFAQYTISQSVGQALEDFYDTPIVAIGVVSAVNSTFTMGRLLVFGGIFLVVFGVIRFFIPDPRTTVLMALLEQSNLEKKNGTSENA